MQQEEQSDSLVGHQELVAVRCDARSPKAQFRALDNDGLLQTRLKPCAFPALRKRAIRAGH